MLLLVRMNSHGRNAVYGNLASLYLSACLVPWCRSSALISGRYPSKIAAIYLQKRLTVCLIHIFDTALISGHAKWHLEYQGLWDCLFRLRWRLCLWIQPRCLLWDPDRDLV